MLFKYCFFIARMGCLLLFIMPVCVAGTTIHCESSQSGSWSSPSTWINCDGGIPDANNKSAVIKSHHSVDLENFLVVGSILFEADSQLNADSVHIQVENGDFDSSLGHIDYESRFKLTVGSGQVSLGSVVGLNDINGIDVSSTGDISIYGQIQARSIELNASAAESTLQIINDISTTFDQRYESPVEILGNVTFTADRINMFDGLNSVGHSFEVSVANVTRTLSVINGITGNASQMIKSGGGHLEIDGSVPVDLDVVVNEGNLKFNDSLGADVVLNGDSSLSGYGRIHSSLVLNDASTLTLGRDYTFEPYAVIEVDSFTSSASSVFSVMFSGTEPGTDQSQLIVSDQVVLNGLLTLNHFNNFDVNDQFIIIDNQGIDPVVGVFAGLPEGSIVQDYFQISYQGGDGNDVTVSPVCGVMNQVTNANDSGPGSLRDAISQVCPENGGVHFQGSYDITLNSPLSFDHDFLQVYGEVGAGQILRSSGDFPVIEVSLDSHIKTFGLGVQDVTSSVGAVVNHGALTMSNAYFANNTNPTHSGGGAITNHGSMTVGGSFYRNNAAYGGAINNTGAMYIVSSSFFQNGHLITQQGAAIYNAGQAELVNVTIAESGNGNGAPGVAFYNTAVNRAVRVVNTVMANAMPGSSECQTVEPIDFFHSDYSTWIEDGSCGAPFSGEPLLGSWGDHGGMTPSVALMLHSPMINAGTELFCSMIATNPFDQRGLPRTLGTSCDIGAIEYNDQTPPTVSAVEVEGQAIDRCDHTPAITDSLQVRFDEPMLDATEPSHYMLRHAGPDQQYFTADDVLVNALTAVSDEQRPEPTITVTLDGAVPEGLNMLTVSGDIRDEFNLYLNDGEDYVHLYRVEPNNVLRSGHFDACAGVTPWFGWDVSHFPSGIGTDFQGSNASYSVFDTISDNQSMTFSQCVDATGMAEVTGYLQAKTVQPTGVNEGVPLMDVSMQCEVYQGSACQGPVGDTLHSSIDGWQGSDDWQRLSFGLGSIDEQTQSMDCVLHVSGLQPNNTEFHFDTVTLKVLNDIIFVNGFDGQ
jgi:hypothetical protein